MNAAKNNQKLPFILFDFFSFPFYNGKLSFYGDRYKFLFFMEITVKELVFELDKSRKVKLYHQLYQNFVKMIESGELAEGAKIPSIRNLSEEYNISRNTVTKAYGELEKDGYIYSMTKSGFYIKNPKDANPIKVENKRPVTIIEEDDDIPTVNSLLRNASQELKEPEVELLQTNLDANPEIHKIDTIILKDSLSVDEVDTVQQEIFENTENSENREVSLLMNSGDIVKSVTNNDVILSPNEAFVDSCITALAEHHNRLEDDKKKDLQGEAPLRIAIAAFIYKFHHIDINPTQVFLGSNISYLLFHLLQLEQFQNPSKFIHGLLHLAQNSISAENMKPVAAIPSDIEPGIRAAFDAAGIKTIEMGLPESEEDLLKLEESKATIFFSTTRILDSCKLTVENYSHIFKWIKERDYRYIIEYDNSTEPKNFNRIYEETLKNRCIYINNFSNLISKSISTSFMALPKTLMESYKSKFDGFGSPISMIEQCGLIDFLMKGKLFNYLTNLEEL